ncbi:MAG: adenylosuccinate synthase [Planctomycetes bacterium]|nr:adenylosuccinate synthase [Planctomycetota bacterium]NUQ35166.1 adenylosuccinate synthase [Planctomycetaceae bacterium]
MNTVAVVGLQWGDEGKGKVINRLAPGFDFVVRYQGGGNAGHTVYVNGQKIVLKHVPSGILTESVTNLMMPGMVLDPDVMFEELDAVTKLGIDFKNRLKISGRVHITTAAHKALDQLRERAAGKGKIGTTGRGIGTTYADKANRLGIRAIDLIDGNNLRETAERMLAVKNPVIEELGGDKLSVDEIYGKLKQWGEKLKPFLADTSLILAEALAMKKRVMFEGAQAAMLDIDVGTYPYVTSSGTTAGAIGSGCGVNVGAVGEVIGVVKAYCTRVGEGAFPTELFDAAGKHMQEVGREFGSTTGRPRRCGWYDAFAARYMVRLGNVSCLAVTKLDVLSGLKELKIGTGYEGWDQPGLPESIVTLGKLKARYETLPGFDGDITGCTRYGDLPVNARALVERIEKLTGAPVKYVSVGPGSGQLIARE